MIIEDCEMDEVYCEKEERLAHALSTLEAMSSDEFKTLIMSSISSGEVYCDDILRIVE
jgi:hypothetical protein